jgi:hypothetical protein
MVCNACGLYYKNRGHRRPVDLKIGGVRRKKSASTTTGSGPAVSGARASMPVGRPPKRRKFEETTVVDGHTMTTLLMTRGSRRKKSRPLRPSRLPLTSLNDVLTGFQQTRFHGQPYHTGDVVSIVGDDSQSYFLVISGFAVIDTEKYFRCYWLVPKLASWLEAQRHRHSLRLFDHEVFTGQEYRLPMSVIREVVYRLTDMPAIDHRLGQDGSAATAIRVSGSESLGAGTLSGKLVLPLGDDEKDTADALLLVQFAHAVDCKTAPRAF